MNSVSGWPPQASPTPGGATSPPYTAPEALRANSHGPLAGAWTAARTMMGWCVVVGLAMLAFYVHILNEQVLRGERHREEMRQSPVPAVSGPGTGGLPRTARSDRVVSLAARNASTPANTSAPGGAANP